MLTVVMSLVVLTGCQVDFQAESRPAHQRLLTLTGLRPGDTAFYSLTITANGTTLVLQRATPALAKRVHLQ